MGFLLNARLVTYNNVKLRLNFLDEISATKINFEDIIEESAVNQLK
jgi:hypothetical protein